MKSAAATPPLPTNKPTQNHQNRRLAVPCSRCFRFVKLAENLLHFQRRR
jgi:hypothetical protein